MKVLNGTIMSGHYKRNQSAGRAPTLHRIPLHLPYNWGKSRKTSVRVTEKISPEQRRKRFV